MGLSLIAAMALGGPELLPPGLHLPLLPSKPIPQQPDRARDRAVGKRKTEVDGDLKRGEALRQQPGGSTAHGQGGSLGRGP